MVALPAETPTVDIHCVTAWSKLDTTWKGVSVDTILAGLETGGEYVRAWCDDGHRTNLPVEVRGLELLVEDRPGFWEAAGYHNYGDPWKEQRYEGD